MDFLNACQSSAAIAPAGDSPVAPLSGNQIGHQNRPGTGQQPGDDAGHEQGADRNTGDIAVDNKGDAGRQDDRQVGGIGNGRAGKAFIIAMLDHGGQQDHAHGGGGRRSGAGQRTPEDAGHDRHHGQTAGAFTHQQFEKPGDGRRQPGPIEDDPGQHEKRDRQEGK